MTLKELKNVHKGDWFFTPEVYEEFKEVTSFLDYTYLGTKVIPLANFKIYEIDHITTKRAILLGYTQYKPGMFYKP